MAFAEWCNEHGGINGRELVVADRDAALTEFNARIIDACSQDFALVGGGAVLDESDNGGRVACGLPNIAGYVVSEEGRPPTSRCSRCRTRSGGWPWAPTR